MFGFLNVRKPSGPTSHDVVAAVRRRLGRGVKVGHAGTLDPFAEGVLVLCVGQATRLADYVQAAPKHYAAEVALGATSSTDDPRGEIEPSPPGAAPDETAVRRVLAGFVGEIQQAPPAYSAVHVEGRRAYKLARAGREVSLSPRPVTVHEIRLVRYEYPLLAIEVRCGGGTYIRALARDVGAALGTGGYCSKLIRTAVGPFRIDAAVPPDRLDPRRDLLDGLAALESMPKFTADAPAAEKIALGRRVTLPRPLPPGDLAVLDPAGTLLAIASVRPDGKTLQPVKVFARP